jgi:integrase
MRFYEAMKAAGMGHRCGQKNGITFHSLRHTFGTRVAAAGVPMRTLQEWMGHRNLATTEIYADYAPDPAYGAAFAEDAFTAKPARNENEMRETPRQDVPSASSDAIGGGLDGREQSELPPLP